MSRNARRDRFVHSTGLDAALSAIVTPSTYLLTDKQMAKSYPVLNLAGIEQVRIMLQN
jgi:hypothetical protein